MKKYLEVFKLSFTMQLIWRFDVVMTMAATAGVILAAQLLWGAVFTGRTIVGGFTFQSMLTYYIVSSFLSSLDKSAQISGEISLLIKEGRFSGHMVTPMNPFAFFGSMTAGGSVFHLGFSLVTALICTVLFGIRLVITAYGIQILLAAALCILGLVFMISFHYFFGILAFRILSIRSLTYLINPLISFATGAFVPLVLLPDAVLGIMRLLPFYYVSYLPSMLLTGRCGSEALSGIVVLSCWTAGFIALNHFCYNRFRVSYDGVGI